MIESIFFDPWIWIIPILLLLCIAWVVIDLVFFADTFIGAMLGGLLLLVGSGVYFGALLPPYDASFYQTYRITGELSQLESAFSGDEGTMSQVFVAKVDGVDLFIRSEDQRFRSVGVGDDVNLVCDKGFAYFQQPWFDCSFGGEIR